MGIGLLNAVPGIDKGGRNGDAVLQPERMLRRDIQAAAMDDADLGAAVDGGIAQLRQGTSNPVLSGALTLGGLNVGGNAKISAGSRVSCEQLNFGSRYIGRILSVLTVEGELALTGNAFIPPDEGQLVLAGSGTGSTTAFPSAKSTPSRRIWVSGC